MLILSAQASLSVYKFSLHYQYKISCLVMRIRQMIIYIEQFIKSRKLLTSLGEFSKPCGLFGVGLRGLLYLPVYNAHLCIMCTPILKPVFRRKAFQHHSWRKLIFWKNSAEMPNPALPAWKLVTGVDANHLMFCLFSDTSSFMMFSSSVLLLHDRTWSICNNTCNIFMNKESWNSTCCHVIRFKMALQRRFAWSFLFQIFPRLFKKPKNKWVDHTSSKPKGKFFMEFTLSSKYSRKCNRFSTMIVNKLHDWQTWTEVMYKAN